MRIHKLVLTGFMGTGKTTIARLLADQTHLPLIDLDERIEQRAGMSIPEIFDKFGEAGFRAWEAAICAEISANPQPAIVSTGGGALLSPANRKAFSAKSTIVCLSARPDVIYQRLNASDNRPLLRTGRAEHALPLLERIHTLLAKRQADYARFRWQLDTSDLTPEQGAEHILTLWQRDEQTRQVEQIVENPEGEYPILIRSGSLRNLPEILDVYGYTQRHLIFATDSVVAPLYQDKIRACLPDADWVVMSAGESYKNLETVYQLYQDFLVHGADRSTVIIALGGGVVGDTVGFAAASFMRGVELIQIPTTLLSMVDSSVGGKVGVDIPQGKNLIGAFKQPELVLIDPETLQTLPPEEIRAGMAEVIKHGLLANPQLLEITEETWGNVSQRDEFIRMAVQVKIDIVQRDPYEKGERAHLNLGHTFGQAIERVSNYTWRHGDAVGVGLVGAAWLSQRLGFISPSIAQEIENLVKEAGLPTRYRDYPPQAIWEAMHTDKKWQHGQNRFVVLKAIAHPTVARGVSTEMVLEILEYLRES